MAQAFCMKCRKNVQISNPRTVVLKNKAVAITGTCPDSGTVVYKFVKRFVNPKQAYDSIV